MNKTDIILSKKDIVDQMNFKDFSHKGHFLFVCDIVPFKKEEKIIISNSNTSLVNKKGILYVFVLEGEVIKIGSATTSFKDRIRSYNCGKKAYRDKGTCSVTNYFVLQSLLKIDEIVKVYGFFPPEIKMDVFGEEEIIALPAKRFEKKLLTSLKKQKKLPIMCTQS